LAVVFAAATIFYSVPWMYNNDRAIPVELDSDNAYLTNTMLGLFEEWESAVAEVQLVAGDTLVLHTDGVTEAENAQDEQFGESGLVETVLAQRHLRLPSLLEAIVTTVQEFSNGEQADDITLMAAQCRPWERNANWSTRAGMRADVRFPSCSGGSANQPALPHSCCSPWSGLTITRADSVTWSCKYAKPSPTTF
jgi:Stage II sporulation protein E (SpoIIE)